MLICKAVRHIAAYSQQIQVMCGGSRMTNTLKLPVGVENFEDIRRLDFYYIDKTKLIEQLLQNW